MNEDPAPKPSSETSASSPSAQGKREEKVVKKRKGFGAPLEKWIYWTIGAFGVLGILALFLPLTRFSWIDPRIAWKVYYLFILIGVTSVAAIAVIAIIAVWRRFQRKKRDDSAALPPKSEKALKKNWIDRIFEKCAYYIVFGFVALGVVKLVDIFPLFREISENGEVLKKEIPQNTYNLFIFIGAGIAAFIATWRGRQAERQINQFDRQLETSRFEKAIEMATDPKSRTRRASGLRLLRQMLSAWRESVDDAIVKNISILDYLVINSFKRTRKQEEAFKKLYEKSKTSFGTDEEKSSWLLFEQTHKPDINWMALNLWKEIVDWNRRRFGNPAVVGVYAPESTPNKSHRFIFSGGSLGDLQFLVIGDDGKIISSTQNAMPDFKQGCFLAVDMHGATVDYVNFSESHFYKINRAEKSKEKCEMSCIGANFTEANLIDCNFRRANFKSASFVGITTLRVIFDEANLTDCKFEGANLGSASFVEVNISGSDFRQAKNLTPKQFGKGAYWIRPNKPQFPESWTDSFINFLARDAQDEEEKGQEEVKAKPLP